MSSKDTAQRIMRRADDAFTQPERYNNEQMWCELTEFMLNNQFLSFGSSTASTTDIGTTTSTTAGAKRTRRLYDSTALKAVQDLAAAFQGTLTNPATVWSKLRFQKDALNNNHEAIVWLEEVNRLMHNKFNESNFNTEIAKGYQSFVSLANMVLFQEVNDEGKFQFSAFHLAQIAWSEDKDNIVDTVHRRFELTAKQAFERWGDVVHDNIIKALETDPDKIFNFLHTVKPRDPKDIKLNELGLAPGEFRPVASIYVDTSHGQFVEESGYYEMPALVARWSLMPNEKYGRGPGHLALPDTRTLNRLKQRALEAIDLQVRPPLLANQRDVFGQLDMRPGQISIVKDHNGVREFVSQARNDVMKFSVEELSASIKEIFFLDKLLLPPRTETGEMTAFEISQRVEQMHRVLGPVLSRVNNELLNPLITRAFKLMLRSGELPETPNILIEQGIDVEIVFVNQLARAQQMQDVTTIQQWVQGLAALAQADPSVIDNINADGIAKHTAKVLGVPEIAVQNDDVIAATREQRAQQQQAAAAMEAGVQMADIASKTDIGEG
jgi:hypothetical protein